MEAALDGTGLAAAESGGEKRGPGEQHLKRRAGCIDPGLNAVAADQEQIRTRAAEVRRVADTPDPADGTSVERRERFATVRAELGSSTDPVGVRMAVVIAAFVGGGCSWVRRWGTCLRTTWIWRGGSGCRRVTNGGLMDIVIRACGLSGRVRRWCWCWTRTKRPPDAFTAGELVGYRDAEVPRSEQEALRRRKVMRKARYKKKRPALLKELEPRYLNS